MKLWKNESARVPLAVIGVLFVLISLAVSTHITEMDKKMAESRLPVVNIKGPNDAFIFFNADMARAINYAAMEAVQQMGETPVIDPDLSSQYNPGGGQIDIAEFNQNWAKGMTMHYLNNYIESNYMYNRYDYHGYAVNVEPLQDWEGIYITPIYMGLDRKLDPPPPIPGPLTPEETHVVYWRVTVPMNVSIVDIATDEIMENKSIRVGNLVLARYPLLESLTTEYETRLNGSNELMIETTALANVYTWGRGYYQYLKPLKGPKNIVSNDHLSLIVNGALMLDQGYVFNSVDPASIIEYGMQTKRTLEDKKDIDMAKFLSSAKLVNGSYEIDPNADAANSTGDPDNATKALEEAQHFDYNATPITDFLNNDSIDSILGVSKVRQQIDKITSQVYSTKLATGVNRHTNETIGAHGGYESSYYTSKWGEPNSMKKIRPLPRDTYVPGNLFGEEWEVTWTRQHVWQHSYTVEFETITGTSTRTEYKYMTAIDTRVDKVAITIKAKENSKTSISMDYDGKPLSTRDDVVKAYTPKDVKYTSAYTDPCLVEAYKSYKNEIFDPNMVANIKDMNLNSDNHNPKTIEAAEPPWLKGEVRNAVDDITQEIKSDVHLDPDINYKTYPNPADAMRATAIDLTTKVKANQSRYVDEASYHNGLKYSSCSAKTISQVREWYVDQVLHQINEQYGNASDQIDDEINSSFGDSADDVREANKNGADLLKSVLCFPIGWTMKAEHVMPNGTHFGKDELAYFDDNVTLGVDMSPDYLKHDKFYDPEQDAWIDAVKIGGRYVADPTESPSSETFIPLSLQNINVFADIPTLRNGGMKLLPPSPYTTWVATTNMWIIRVKGRFHQFNLYDFDNECHPHPIFGHEAQIFSREDYVDIRDPTTGSVVGNNDPIEFEFTTGTFIIVPRGQKGIGDRRDERTNEKSIGAINEGW